MTVHRKVDTHNQHTHSTQQEASIPFTTDIMVDGSINTSFGTILGMSPELNASMLENIGLHVQDVKTGPAATTLLEIMNMIHQQKMKQERESIWTRCQQCMTHVTTKFTQLLQYCGVNTLYAKCRDKFIHMLLRNKALERVLLINFLNLNANKFTFDATDKLRAEQIARSLNDDALESVITYLSLFKSVYVIEEQKRKSDDASDTQVLEQLLHETLACQEKMKKLQTHVISQLESKI